MRKGRDGEGERGRSGEGRRERNEKKERGKKQERECMGKKGRGKKELGVREIEIEWKGIRKGSEKENRIGSERERRK